MLPYPICRPSANPRRCGRGQHIAFTRHGTCNMRHATSLTFLSRRSQTKPDHVSRFTPQGSNALTHFNLFDPLNPSHATRPDPPLLQRPRITLYVPRFTFPIPPILPIPPIASPPSAPLANPQIYIRDPASTHTSPVPASSGPAVPSSCCPVVLPSASLDTSAPASEIAPR